MSLPNVIQLTRERVDSRLMAHLLGTKHRNTFELVSDHKADFDELGILRFQTEVIKGRGQPEKFALLNEDHCYLLLTYSRNTAIVRDLKLKLVKTFRDSRRATEVRQFEYLPAYHALHDAIKLRADGSPNERFMHMNANRTLNQLAGVQPGRRAVAGVMEQSLMAIGSALAAKAVLDATNAHGLHERIKTSLKPLEGLLMLNGEAT